MSLVTRLPAAVFATKSGAGLVLYVGSGQNYDYAIGGLPFFSAADKNNPTIRKTAPFRKPQVDQSSEPGEQSLQNWWVKSQSSFHGGAGQKYMDTPIPNGALIRPVRYQTSTGIDPWTKGEFKLLPAVSRAYNSSLSTGARLVSAVDGSGNGLLLLADGSALTLITETVSLGVPTYSTQSVAWGGAGTIRSVTTDGINYYLANDSGVYKGVLATPGVAAVKIYNLAVVGGICRWVKQRLMLLLGNKAYELDCNTGAGTALPTALYTHPNPSWTWTDMMEGPSAIYASGYAGQSSSIFKFILDTSTGTPVLTTGIPLAELTAGEIVWGMRGYMSTMVGLATSSGFRTGQFDANGDINYGPLSISWSLSKPAGVVGKDRFFYAAYTAADGVAGVARVDLSQEISIRPYYYTPDQVYAWAPDLRANNGTSDIAGFTQDVTLINGRVAFLVPGSGVFVEHPSHYVTSGSLTTSRLRFDTLDPKLIRYARFRGEGTGTATIAVNGSSDSGGPISGGVTLPTTTDSGDLAVSLSPQTYVTVTIALTGSGTDTPVISGYQLKALPAQRRQRAIVLQLSCFDHESDSTGGFSGGDGTALSRLSHLEALESTGDVVNLQWLGPTADQSLTELVTIEDVQFMQTSGPTDTQGWGGIISITLKTVN